jgi:hypothetical protein
VHLAARPDRKVDESVAGIKDLRLFSQHVWVGTYAETSWMLLSSIVAYAIFSQKMAVGVTWASKL